MTQTFRRIGLGVGATALALLMAGTSYQNLSAQGPDGGGRGGRPGWGGPGGPGRGGPGGPGGLGPMMLERLNLTTDQRDRVRQIMDSHRDEQKAIGDREMTARGALNDAITGPFDEGAIRSQAANLAAVDADQAVLQARIYGEVFQILTSEQQQQLKQLQADMKARATQMRQERGDRSGGQKH
jgi:Spy/CpxP family protein refolding chaperone